MSPPSSLTAFLLVVSLVSIASADSIGVNYDSVADNLPPHPKVATFVRDNSIIGRTRNSISNWINRNKPSIPEFSNGVCAGVGIWIGQPVCHQSQPLPLNPMLSPPSPMLPPPPPSQMMPPPPPSQMMPPPSQMMPPSPPSQMMPPSQMLPPSPPSLSPSLPSPTTGMIFCVAKNGASEQALQSNIDYACGSGGVDCGPIQSGGPCFDPDTIQSHATYVMNAYYKKSGGKISACDFAGTGVLVNDDPSYGMCKYST